MAQQRINNKTWLGAVLYMIKRLALMLVNATEVADDAVAVAGKAVRTARKKHAATSAIDLKAFVTVASREAAIAETVSANRLVELAGGDQAKLDALNKSAKSYHDLVAHELALIDAEGEDE